jgi:hypothetical protein
MPVFLRAAALRNHYFITEHSILAGYCPTPTPWLFIDSYVPVAAGRDRQFMGRPMTNSNR